MPVPACAECWERRMTDPLDRRDADLREAGQKWRARRAAPPSINASTFSSDASTQHSSRRLIGSLAAVAALVVVAVLVVVTLPPPNDHVATTSPSPNATPARATASPGSSATHIPTGSLSPSPSPSGDGVSWRVLQPSDLPGIGGFFGLKVQDGRFLADAYSCAEGDFSDQVACDGERMLLASDDGESWSELARMDGGPFITHFFAGDGYFLASAFF